MNPISNPTYLSPQPKVAQDFFKKTIEGPIVMLNLLRFKTIANYEATPALAPEEGSISGQKAYQIYMSKMDALFHKMGCEIQLMGKTDNYLIGPEAESWDAVLLVKYPSKGTFFGFAQHKIYLQNAGHRTAALADSRLLPIAPGPIFE